MKEVLYIAKNLFTINIKAHLHHISQDQVSSQVMVTQLSINGVGLTKPLQPNLLKALIHKNWIIWFFIVVEQFLKSNHFF